MRVLVFGFGHCNQSLLRYFKKVGGYEIGVYDSRGDDWFFSFKNELEGCSIIKSLDEALTYPTWYASPGIPETHSWLNSAKENQIVLSNDIDFFTKQNIKPIIAITGSNGKSTVSAMIAHLAKSLGLKVGLGGNFGTPVYDLDGDVDIYVLELSSFQLYYTKNLGAKVAIFTNFVADHLDWHVSLDGYFQSKHHIFNGAEIAIVSRQDKATWPKNNVPIVKKVSLTEVSTGELDFLIGEHQKVNALMALAAGSLMGWPDSKLKEAIKTYQALPHRMKSLGYKRDVLFINDSKATNIASSIAAIKSFEKTSGRVWVLLGGRGKGQDFKELAPVFLKKHLIPVVYGECQKSLMDALSINSAYSNLKSAFNETIKKAQKGDTILLSPACSSFDEFKNFEDRGNQFESWVASL